MSQFAFLVLFNADIILLEPVLWVAAVSTGGPGEMSGTVRSAETTRSSLAHSGTGKTPERCFGNSGGNWSARRRKQEKGVNDDRRDANHTGAGRCALFIKGACFRSVAADSTFCPYVLLI